MPTSDDLIAPTAAVNAIYIDFEGNQNKPPSLLGVRWRAAEMDHFAQFVLEEALFPAVDGSPKTVHKWPGDGYQRAEGVEARPGAAKRATVTLLEAVRSLVSRAEAEGRLLVSWSTYEREVISSVLLEVDSDLTNRFVGLWRDGKATAKKWKRLKHPSKVFKRIVGLGTHRLDEYMNLVKYPVPRHFGHRQAAARISYARNQLTKRKTYARLTPVAKAKWTKLLDYNWHDCTDCVKWSSRRRRRTHRRPAGCRGFARAS